MRVEANLIAFTRRVMTVPSVNWGIKKSIRRLLKVKKIVFLLLLSMFMMSVTTYSLAASDLSREHEVIYNKCIAEFKFFKVIVEKDFLTPQISEDENKVTFTYIPVKGAEFFATYEGEKIYQYGLSLTAGTYAFDHSAEITLSFVYALDQESKTYEDAGAVIEYLAKTLDIWQELPGTTLKMSEIERDHLAFRLVNALSDVIPSTLAIYAESFK